MKILHVDETFHPNFGYHSTPLSKFQQKQGHDIYVIAPEKRYLYPFYRSFGEYGHTLEEDDKRFTDSTGVQIIRVPGKGRIANRLIYDYKALFHAVEMIKPDAIMVHCIETLTAMAVMAKFRNKYPMVFDSHMLAMASKNRFAKLYEQAYRLLVTSSVKRRKYTVLKTQDDDYVTSHLGIPEEQTVFASFGTDTMLFCPAPEKKAEFLRSKGLPQDTFLIVSTGKMTEAKDGKLFAKAMEKQFHTQRPVAAVVVADFSHTYEAEVKAMLEKSENQIFFYPVQKYINLPWFYQIADAVVFPKQCSMSFYDAQSCGAPVVLEKGKVNEDRICRGNGLSFVQGDVADFREKLEQLMNMPEAEYQKMRQNSIAFIAEGYSYDIIARQYTDILEKEYRRFNNQ